MRAGIYYMNNAFTYIVYLISICHDRVTSANIDNTTNPRTYNVCIIIVTDGMDPSAGMEYITNIDFFKSL